MRSNSNLLAFAATVAAGFLALIISSLPATAQEGGAPNTNASKLYLRGDLGIGWLDMGSVKQSEVADNGGAFVSQSLDNSKLISLGVGWQLNKQFRADLTGEYRWGSDFKALDSVNSTLLYGDGTVEGTAQVNTLYRGDVSAYVGLMNGYVDLFRWGGFTPYIGAGVGLARVKISDFTTSSTVTFTDASTGDVTKQTIPGSAASNSETNFAWALMAGTSYDLAPDAKLDIGYRYLNLGGGGGSGSDGGFVTGALSCGCGAFGSPLSSSGDLDSHEIRVGLRWTMN
jgi:opacity protein-like surface antigen